MGKPKNLWAGKGLVVSASAAAVADGKGVVQRYIDRPLLIGGFKSHLRVYMLLTAVRGLRTSSSSSRNHALTFLGPSQDTQVYTFSRCIATLWAYGVL